MILVSPNMLPRPIRLTLLQQWNYFRQPMFMHEWLCQRYKDLAVLRFQGHDFVAILTPEGIRQVFSADPDGYDVFWKDAFTGLSGSEVVFVVAGEKHRRERQSLAQIFNAHNYRAYAEAIRRSTRRFTAQWQPGQTIRVMDTTSALWLDIIMHLFFGLEDGAFLEEGKRIHAEMQQSMHLSIVFFPALQRGWFPLWNRYTRVKVAFTDWIRRYLLERRNQGPERDDVIERILALGNEGGLTVRDGHIYDVLYSILGPGHQTTATALAWAIYELGRHPRVLEKLRMELATFGNDSDPALLVTLPYLSAICNETLRLHPIIAECARVPLIPMEILNYSIPAGLGLVISITGIHHNPELYPEPERFIPERFIEHTYTPFEFIPFGGGHRRCMGAGLAEHTMRIAIAEIASNWDFETATVDQDVRQSLTMGPRHGVLLRIKARRRTNENEQISYTRRN